MFEPIKGGIFHSFRHLDFHIKIHALSFFLSLYFCNIQVLIHVILSLISYLCLSFSLFYLINLYHSYVLNLIIYVFLFSYV